MRVEGIITSLVFDHALRIRLKAEAAKKDESKDTASVNTGPGSEMKDSASPSPDNTSTASDEDDNTLHSRSTTNASTSTAATVVVQPPAASTVKGTDPKKEEEKEETPKSKGANLIGKINNLVTSDLEHITEGRDFLFISMYPSITLCPNILTIQYSPVCTTANHL